MSVNLDFRLSKYMFKSPHSNKNGICICVTATKVKTCAIGALITIILTKQCETLQLHNNFCAIFLLTCFVQRNSQVSLLASTSRVEGTQDSDSDIQVCGSRDFTIRQEGSGVNRLECLGHEPRGSKRLGCQCFGCECRCPCFGRMSQARMYWIWDANCQCLRCQCHRCEWKNVHLQKRGLFIISIFPRVPITSHSFRGLFSRHRDVHTSNSCMFIHTHAV